MARFDKSAEIDYYLHDGLDIIVDEKGTQFLALRKVQWCEKGAEPDPSKAKLELRKWIPNPNGDKDKPQKGVTFLTEEGPHELAKALVANGYGKTKDILVELKKRDDFKETVENFNNESEDSDEYFDARSLLLEE